MTPAARRASISAPIQKPASVGRSCVVEETSDCARILVVPPESAALVLLEIEQTVAEDAEARQRLADRRLHRAQILAHHHHLVAHAFERQDAHEVQRALAHVGALGGVARRRESSRGGRGASRGRCAARRRAGSSCGSIRRTGGSRPRDAAPNSAAESAQSWPLGEKSSGGEPTRQPVDEERPVRPQIAAEAVGGQRQVVIQADRQDAGRAPAAARARNCRSICHCRYW